MALVLLGEKKHETELYLNKKALSPNTENSTRRSVPLATSRTNRNKSNNALADEKLLELARKHFLNDFPNPSRPGCPATNQLKLLAVHPLRAPASVLSHHLLLLALLPRLQPFFGGHRRNLRPNSPRPSRRPSC
jgi:hypothetical protein